MEDWPLIRGLASEGVPKARITYGWEYRPGDRIVHHADVLTFKGASYRIRGRGIDSLPGIKTSSSETTN